LTDNDDVIQCNTHAKYVIWTAVYNVIIIIIIIIIIMLYRPEI